MDIQEHREQSDAIRKQLSAACAGLAEAQGYDLLHLDRGNFLSGFLQSLLASMAVEIPAVMERLQLDGLVEQGQEIPEQEYEQLAIPAFLRRQAI